MIEKLDAIKNNNHIFYKSDNLKITYKDLWASAYELANALKSEGTSPVIIYGDKSIDMVISIVASLIAKRAYIPISYCTPLERLKEIIKLTNSTLLINNSQNKLQDVNIECLDIQKIKQKYRIVIKNNIENNNEIAYIMFTSGSTGKPKGVPITYSNLNNFIEWISNFEVLKDYKNINVLNQASFSFDLSVADLYYTLFNDHTLIGLPNSKQNDLNYVLSIIKSNNINLMVITPTFAKFLLLDNSFNSDNYPNLKCIYFCGEVLDVATVKKLKIRFNDIAIINAYGPTEATSAVSGVLITNEMLDLEYLPVGCVNTSAVDIEIINNEIVLIGKSVFSGYLNIKSNRCFKKNNINGFKTNDLGYYKNDYLFCKGRIDNQIKYSGYRIELEDIENNLLKIEGIKECVAVAKRDNNTVKFIKAFVVTDKFTDSSCIKEELKRYIPEYMIPKNIQITKKIPVNSNGKYDRKALENL